MTAVYKKMGLNNRQIQIIANAIPKRQYYYVSEEGRRLFELALGPLQLALIAVSDIQNTLNQLKTTMGSIKNFSSMAGGGGLAAAMSGGLSFAYAMAANLASGAGSAVKDELQRTTLSGKMLASIEADTQIQGGGDQKQSGGADDSSGENGVSVGNSGATAASADTTGLGAVDSQDSSTESGLPDGMDGVGIPDFGAGALGSGSDDAGFCSDWDDAIANYDPGKVGLPDDS